jgi:prepilin-type N-terminal cleavage/methylation domain-containing protein
MPHQSNTWRLARPRKGFTFVEVVVSVVILSLVAGSIIWGLNQLNYYASVSRLYTAAQTLAQNQIDLILTKAPFDPVNGFYPTPNWLRTDTKYYTVVDPLATLPNPTQTTTSTSVPLYVDPSNSANKPVMATIETVVKNSGALLNGVTDLNVYQATVTVKYTFRRRNYTVQMDTMRTTDS